MDPKCEEIARCAAEFISRGLTVSAVYIATGVPMRIGDTFPQESATPAVRRATAFEKVPALDCRDWQTIEPEPLIREYFADALATIAAELSAAGAPIQTFSPQMPKDTAGVGFGVADGVAVRYICVYDIVSDQFTHRFDAFWREASTP